MVEIPGTSSSTDSRTGTQSTEFHLFPDLPTELRLQIWKHALQPRLVDIDDPSGARGPAILLVNRESRNISRPEYRLLQAKRLRDNEEVGFFINPSIDFFCVRRTFPEAEFWRWPINYVLHICYRAHPWLNMSQRLVISLTPIFPQTTYLKVTREEPPKELRDQFPYLKELIIVINSEGQHNMEELVAIQRGDGELGQIVRHYEDSLQKAQSRGLYRNLKLSVMRRAATGPLVRIDLG